MVDGSSTPKDVANRISARVWAGALFLTAFRLQPTGGMERIFGANAFCFYRRIGGRLDLARWRQHASKMGSAVLDEHSQHPERILWINALIEGSVPI